MPEVTKEISAGIIVYRMTKDGPKFLLLYHGGSYWNFPKGHIEREEKSLEAALRETFEEAGLKPDDLKIRNRFKDYEKYHFYKGKNKIFKVVIFYLAESRTKNVKISEEHGGYGWFLYRDARRILKTYRDSESVLKRAHDFIRGPLPEKRESIKST